MEAVLNSMTVAERRVVAETSREALAGLDEEELLALHARIRRARLAAARSQGSGPKKVAARAASGEIPAASRQRATKKTTGGIKKDASSRAAGARRQAKRDAR